LARWAGFGKVPPRSVFPASTSSIVSAVDAFFTAKTPQVRRTSLLSIGIGLACLVGCARFNPRGDGFQESFIDAAQYKRSTEPSALPSAYSEKARSIERDFGVK
jgi:hypothetical protein